MEWFRPRKDAQRQPTTAPEAPVDTTPMGKRQQRDKTDPGPSRKIKRRRRTFFFLLGVIFIVGTVSALFGEDGFFDRLRMRGELRVLQAQVEAKRQDVAELERAIERLKHDPMARERIAREQLGFVGPDEYLFILPEERDPRGKAGIPRERSPETGETAGESSP